MKNQAEKLTELLTTLVNGGDFKDVEVLREGTKIVLPPGMTYDRAIEWMARKRDEDEHIVAVNEVIHAFPLDACAAFMKALQKVYGWSGLAPTPGFFGSRPPMMIGVEIDPAGHTISVPWGNVVVPSIDGKLNTGADVIDNKLVFVLRGEVKQKDFEKVRQLANLTRDLVKTESLYKGRALRVKLRNWSPDDNFDPRQGCPKFIDTSNIRENELILPNNVMRQIDTTLFAPIEHTAMCRTAQVPLKRGVLLHGTYGVGKTLAAYITALKAVNNGWTFIYIEDTAQLEQAVYFAKNYTPAVIFAEDVDRIGEQNNGDALRQAGNVIDGVVMKGEEIIVVLTTNHIAQVDQFMLRPGRLDAVIPVPPPDADSVQRLIRLYARELLDPRADLTKVGNVLSGQIPAVIREVVERSKLSAINRLADNASKNGKTSPLHITSQDLDEASEGMIEHLKLLQIRPKDNRTGIEKGFDLFGYQMARAVERVAEKATEDELVESLNTRQ